MHTSRALWVAMLLCAAAIGAQSAPSSYDKGAVSFSPVRFQGVREVKAVSFAAYVGPDAELKGRFDAARAEFDQSLLRLTSAGAPTPELVSALVRQAEAWAALAADAAVPAEVRAAALHNAANCYTVARDSEQALRLAAAAVAMDPAQKAYVLERDAIRDGFYLKRSGYNTVMIEAPRIEAAKAPGPVSGVRSAVVLNAPRVRVTPIRTPLQATGAIWINDRKSYRVSHTESVVLDSIPLAAVLTLENRTERVIDCRGVVVQVSVNGNPVGGSARLAFQGDATRVLPGGKLLATFGTVNAATLPASGTLTVEVFDVPSAVSAAGAVEARRNDRFEWTIGRASYAFDTLNRVIEEKISPEEAALENRPIAQPPRFEPLTNPVR